MTFVDLNLYLKNFDFGLLMSNSAVYNYVGDYCNHADNYCNFPDYCYWIVACFVKWIVDDMYIASEY